MRLAIGLIGGAALAASTAAAAVTPPRAADVAAVKSVLSAYKAAIERLDASGTERLFTDDSMMFETGGSEGTYAKYLSHHLAPELKKFRSFRFSDPTVSVRLIGPATALASETYKYRIETAQGEVAERLGVATSVLRKDGGRWKILMMHNSGRKPSGQ